MRILFVAAEAAPIAKVGGMGRRRCPAQSAKAMGHDVRIFMPYYGFLPDKMTIPKIQSGTVLPCSSLSQSLKPSCLVPMFPCTYLVIRSFSPPHLLWADEDWRFTLFANGAAEFCWNYWKPELSIAMTGMGMIPVWMHQSPSPSLLYTTCLSRAVELYLEKITVSLVYAGITPWQLPCSC